MIRNEVHLDYTDGKLVAVSSGIGNEIVSYVTERKEYREVTHLNFAANRINEEGIRLLALAGWNHIIVLELGWNYIPAKAVKLLAAATWPNLQELGLLSNVIQDEGAYYLRYGNWPNLCLLNISTSDCLFI